MVLFQEKATEEKPAENGNASLSEIQTGVAAVFQSGVSEAVEKVTEAAAPVVEAAEKAVSPVVEAAKTPVEDIAEKVATPVADAVEKVILPTPCLQSLWNFYYPRHFQLGFPSYGIYLLLHHSQFIYSPTALTFS